MRPTAAASIAQTKTAAADISLISFTFGSIRGEIKSMILSIAVLNISAAHTIPITIISKAYSIGVAFK